MIEAVAGWLIVMLIIVGLAVWAVVGVTWLVDWFGERK